MKKLITLFFTLFALSACVHKMDIEQGNVVTPAMITKLHIGMSETQVKAVLGTPMLLNIFTRNQINYVYSLKTAYHPLVEKKLTLTFKSHRLQHIEKSL